ncbi:AraC family transcriptional regulator [Paraburkholderia sp.]|uniref:AraC family transcriptional regulator n=1 Tax=Paraburkholderia sp. TaxID=1926495 RepID=UPI00239F5229|nr:AraC family transcriptional regulator [Paraburkholderia sp.]MDE1180031.1 AraC family transcriptional regulator [Paraburkholderia sp.]
MDLLADIVRLLRPEILDWKTIESNRRWGMIVPPLDLPRFSLVTAGTCWYVPDVGTPLFMRQGDYLLLTQGHRYRVVSDMDVVRDLDDLSTRSQTEDPQGYVRWQGEPLAETTRLVGGYFQVAPEQAALTSALLPELVHVRFGDEDAGQLHPLIGLIANEAGCALPGHNLVMGRLIELMLVEILRHPMQRMATEQKGWLGGLSDPRIATALQAIHADIARQWTLETLSQHVGMSRSAFVQRFCEKVGVPPGAYVSSWRLAIAKDALLDSDRSVANIALAIGYLSDSAFSTAFKRAVGCSPRQFRDTQRNAPI